MTSIVIQDFSFVTIVQSVTNFIAAFEKERCVSPFAVQLLDIDEDMVSSDLLTSKSSQTYQSSICVAKIFLLRSNILNPMEVIEGRETGSRTFGISRLDDGTSFSFWTED